MSVNHFSSKLVDLTSRLDTLARSNNGSRGSADMYTSSSLFPSSSRDYGYTSPSSPSNYSQRPLFSDWSFSISPSSRRSHLINDYELARNSSPELARSPPLRGSPSGFYQATHDIRREFRLQMEELLKTFAAERAEEQRRWMQTLAHVHEEHALELSLLCEQMRGEGGRVEERRRGVPAVEAEIDRLRGENMMLNSRIFDFTKQISLMQQMERRNLAGQRKHRQEGEYRQTLGLVEENRAYVEIGQNTIAPPSHEVSPHSLSPSRSESDLSTIGNNPDAPLLRIDRASDMKRRVRSRTPDPSHRISSPLNRIVNPASNKSSTRAVCQSPVPKTVFNLAITEELSTSEESENPRSMLQSPGPQVAFDKKSEGGKTEDGLEMERLRRENKKLNALILDLTDNKAGQFNIAEFFADGASPSDLNQADSSDFSNPFHFRTGASPLFRIGRASDIKRRMRSRTPDPSHRISSPILKTVFNLALNAQEVGAEAEKQRSNVQSPVAQVVFTAIKEKEMDVKPHLLLSDSYSTHKRKDEVKDQGNLDSHRRRFQSPKLNDRKFRSHTVPPAPSWAFRSPETSSDSTSDATPVVSAISVANETGDIDVPVVPNESSPAVSAGYRWTFREMEAKSGDCQTAPRLKSLHQNSPQEAVEVVKNVSQLSISVPGEEKKEKEAKAEAVSVTEVKDGKKTPVKKTAALLEKKKKVSVKNEVEKEKKKVVGRRKHTLVPASKLGWSVRDLVIPSFKKAEVLEEKKADV